MALDRMNFILDGDSRFQGRQAQQEPPPDAAPAPPPDQGGGAPPEGGGPPDGPPGNPPAPPPTAAPPPQGPTAVQGLQESSATGGVGGSFGQAGTPGFARRFGSVGQDSPATWFRRQSVLPGQGFEESRRRVLAGAGGQTTGGQGEAAPGIAAAVDAGGTPQDEEWQRFMQAVMQQRFGVGGRR